MYRRGWASVLSPRLSWLSSLGSALPGVVVSRNIPNYFSNVTLAFEDDKKYTEAAKYCFQHESLLKYESRIFACAGQVCQDSFPKFQGFTFANSEAPVDERFRCFCLSKLEKEVKNSQWDSGKADCPPRVKPALPAA